MIPLPALSLCVMAGLSPLLFMPTLPSVSQIAGLTVMSSLTLFLQYRAARFVALTLLFLCWGLLAAKQAMLPYTLLTGKTHQVEGVITGTDGATTPDQNYPVKRRAGVSGSRCGTAGRLFTAKGMLRSALVNDASPAARSRAAQ